MKDLTRRDVLKGGMAMPAASAIGMADAAAFEQSGQAANALGPAPHRECLLLDFGWRFHFGHANDASKDFGFGSGRSGGFQKTGGFLAPSSLAYDDSEWRSIDLPHDWAIGLPFQNDPALASKGSYPLGRDYPETSVGWYRRVFELPAADAGRRIRVEFDGAYRDTMVVFNGYYIGRHGGGYDPFSFDLTDFASFGAPNVLLVRVDATLSDGWFYEGAGIYRHVWLVKTAPVHVKKWGTLAAAKVQSGSAALSIRTEVENHGKGAQNARVISTILDPAGREVVKTASQPASISEWGERTYEQQITVKQPALWSLEERNLYRLVTEVESAGNIVDRYETRFGIRELKFDAAQGFLLNGKPVKVKGTCNHQDHAGVGAALPDAVQSFRVRKLQEMGCNAIRTSHNPPTPELLNACDELGMLVLDETRMLSSNPEGLAQFENMVRRDRNHPSVFIWSMGNEESVSPTETGLRLLTSMKRIPAKHDGSRPVSIAPPPMGDYMGKGGLAVCDVMGYNYADPQAEAYHKGNPTVPILGTENVSAVGTRGQYVTDRAKGTVASYDPYTTTGRASAEGWWRFVSARPYIAGGFVWTGFDYRGEPSPYGWPNISSQYGVIDTCGFPKDTFYYYRSWWTSQPVLHVFPHWNWPGLEGQEIAVWVHSNMDRVELFLNGQSLGAKEMQKDQHLAWAVKYAPGTIEARGYKDGRHAMTAKRETAGPAARLVLRADRREVAADGEDVAFLTVEVQDAEGRTVPVTDNPVTFRVTGPGKVIGTGNGDPTNHEPDGGSSRKAFAGLCMAIVQSTKSAGNLRVEATSPGLASASATIASKAVTLRPQVAVWEREVPAGTGITGLWRPEAVVAAAPNNPMALAGGGNDMVFTFRQDGSTVTGSVESAAAGGFGGGAGGGPIQDGRIEGGNLTFRAGPTTYTGTVNGDRIELRRSGPAGRGGRGGGPPAAGAGPRPAIGPPPDGSDPSFGAGPGGGRGGQVPASLVLKRATR
ncbi:MAG TPA: beta-galactosidase GalA [Candidatus Acidoferrales bacterium]|nr:beta-galactosidase GalA [Candidatus Acidoferrales bacterium]